MAVLLRFILSKVNKFSRQNDWYLASVFKEMSEEDKQEHFEEFFSDPILCLQDDFEIEYYQMIENIALYFEWPMKKHYMDKLAFSQSYSGS